MGLHKFLSAVAIALVAVAASGFSRIGSVAADNTGTSLFSSYDVVSLTLNAPLDDLFARVRKSPEASVTGAVAFMDPSTGREISIDGVEVSVRGHTSRDEGECQFPKLRLRFTKTAESPLLAGLKGLKIGTHCGDQGDDQLTRKYGRVANEKAPHREAVVYRLLEVIGVPSLKARPAKITYVSPGGQSIVRNAMLLEDTHDVAKRLGASGEIDAKDFDSAQTMFAAADAARLAFAEAMIGNFDWCLKFSATDTYRCDAEKRLWNVLALRRPDGTAIPVMNDFDLSGMVTGWHSWFDNVFNESFVPSKSRRQIEVLSQVQRTRSLFQRPELDAVRRSFLERKDAAFRALDQSALDPDGIQQIRDYLTSFFEAIASDDAFYLPMVAREGVKAYRDAEGQQLACAREPMVPVGSLAGAPLDTRGDMVQVRLLDVQWHWTGSAKCDAARNGPVWVDAKAIDRNYPSR